MELSKREQRLIKGAHRMDRWGWMLVWAAAITSVILFALSAAALFSIESYMQANGLTTAEVFFVWDDQLGASMKSVHVMSLIMAFPSLMGLGGMFLAGAIQGWVGLRMSRLVLKLLDEIDATTDRPASA